MPKTLLTNSFHRTQIRIQLPDPNLDGSWTLSRAQVAHAKARLCGSGVCTCSNALGIRGMRYLLFLEAPDGSGVLIDTTEEEQ